jgi:hypothetical protein
MPCGRSPHDDFDGSLLAIASTDPLIWQVPIRRSARVWARVVLLTLSGAFAAAFVAGMHRAHGFRPPEPWSLYLPNLVMTWIGGGLLLFLAGDLIRRAHVFVQAFVVIVAASPAVAMITLHILPGLSWPALPAEAAAAVALLLLNLHVNRDLEFTFTPTAVGKESPRDAVAEPGESCRIAVRVPSLASALFRAQLASVLHWVFIAFWIALSLAPLGIAWIIPCVILPPVFVMRLLEVWRPFQATPAPRGKAMAVLFLPLLGLWILTVALQCWSVQWSETTLFTGSLTGFRLPLLTREVPSAELERRLTKVPPQKIAELVHDAYRTGYGLDVPVSEILSLQDPEGTQEGWLLEVDRHWKSKVRGRFLEWRLLFGAMTLAWGMLSFVPLLPGRWPKWISGYFMIIPYLLIVFPMFFPRAGQRPGLPAGAGSVGLSDRIRSTLDRHRRVQRVRRRIPDPQLCRVQVHGARAAVGKTDGLTEPLLA